MLHKLCQIIRVLLIYYIGKLNTGELAVTDNFSPLLATPDTVAMPPSTLTILKKFFELADIEEPEIPDRLQILASEMDIAFRFDRKKTTDPDAGKVSDPNLISWAYCVIPLETHYMVVYLPVVRAMNMATCTTDWIFVDEQLPLELGRETINECIFRSVRGAVDSSAEMRTMIVPKISPGAHNGLCMLFLPVRPPKDSRLKGTRSPFEAEHKIFMLCAQWWKLDREATDFAEEQRPVIEDGRALVFFPMPVAYLKNGSNKHANMINPMFLEFDGDLPPSRAYPLKFFSSKAFKPYLMRLLADAEIPLPEIVSRLFMPSADIVDDAEIDDEDPAATNLANQPDVVASILEREKELALQRRKVAWLARLEIATTNPARLIKEDAANYLAEKYPDITPTSITPIPNLPPPLKMLINKQHWIRYLTNSPYHSIREEYGAYLAESLGIPPCTGMPIPAPSRAFQQRLASSSTNTSGGFQVTVITPDDVDSVTVTVSDDGPPEAKRRRTNVVMSRRSP